MDKQKSGISIGDAAYGWLGISKSTTHDVHCTPNPYISSENNSVAEVSIPRERADGLEQYAESAATFSFFVVPRRGMGVSFPNTGGAAVSNDTLSASRHGRKLLQNSRLWVMRFGDITLELSRYAQIVLIESIQMQHAWLDLSIDADFDSARRGG